LAVARSLGDRDFKYEASLAAGMPITADLVSASPEVRSNQLKCLPASISKHACAHHGALASPQVRICRVQQGDELLLACDGLWDVLSGEAAFEYLHSHGAAESPQRAVSLLVQAADEQFNSLDNITACYVRLSTAE
jgi:serine/threonine protein phosphatase PrpC